MKIKSNSNIIIELIIYTGPLWLTLFFDVDWNTKIQYFTNPNVNEKLLQELNYRLISGFISLTVLIVFYSLVFIFWDKIKDYISYKRLMPIYIIQNIFMLMNNHKMCIPIFLNTKDFFHPSKSTFLFSEYYDLSIKYSDSINQIFILIFVLSISIICFLHFRKKNSKNEVEY
jgi:hypothetical protein